MWGSSDSVIYLDIYCHLHTLREEKGCDLMLVCARQQLTIRVEHLRHKSHNRWLIGVLLRELYC